MSKHTRKPRRQSQSIVVLQIGFVLLQIGLVLIEVVDAVSRLLGYLW
ncbi:hypothetical protein [Lentzea sp. E54]